jgi:hypothetical protein
MDKFYQKLWQEASICDTLQGGRRTDFEDR